MKTIIRLMTDLFGYLNFPFTIKKYELNDHNKIEEYLDSLKIPLAIFLVRTDGVGTNLLINLVNLFAQKTRKKIWGSTHAIIYIGNRNGKKHRVIESVGSGLREVSLIEAIAQRDLVVCSIPLFDKFNMKVQKNMLEFCHLMLDKDNRINIEYDLDHDLLDPIKMDCSELLFHATNYGFSKADQHNPIKPVIRLGRPTWTPNDIYVSEFFKIVYDNSEEIKEI